MSTPKRKIELQKKAIQMPKQKAINRTKNFNEVALGYSEEQAIKEAKRCLQCQNSQCIKGCPVEVNIPVFIKLITEKKFDVAIKKIKERNVLPAICGRVCPQEVQCQKLCLLGKIGDAISIGRLERFVADWERKRGALTPQKKPSIKKNVAIIGAGPAGVTAAFELANLGYEVVIFEALHLPGGVLMYGIPEFRLPKDVVQSEINYIRKLGVKIRCNYLVGRTGTIPELLKKGFDAVFIGTGAGLPQFLGLPGENLGGIYSANEFLIRVNLMKAFAFPEYDTPIKIGEQVAIIGGGNVAMDAARSALRLGAKQVHIVYRRSRDEIPGRIEEVENAEEEGVLINFLTNPTRFIGNKNGCVKSMEVVRMKLGAPDETGRRRPLPIKDSEFIIDVDTVVVAIGRTPNPIIQRTTDGLEVSKWGTIVVNEQGKTSLEGVYAGGDVVTGEATVISAMGAGKKAAKAINEYLSKQI